MKWLRKCFPSFPKAVQPSVQLDLPEWTLADCAQLEAFLASRTGAKMIERFQHTATAMCLDTDHADHGMSSDRRALAFVIEGIKSLSNEDYWKFRDKDFLEREFLKEDNL